MVGAGVLTALLLVLIRRITYWVVHAPLIIVNLTNVIGFAVFFNQLKAIVAFWLVGEFILGVKVIVLLPELTNVLVPTGNEVKVGVLTVAYSNEKVDALFVATFTEKLRSF